MQAWDFLLEIVLLLGAALLMGILMERLKQNVLIGYLFTGIILGPSGVRLVASGEEVHAVAELGVALLLFTIGLEFSFSRLRTFGAAVGIHVAAVRRPGARHQLAPAFGVALVPRGNVGHDSFVGMAHGLAPVG